MAILDHVAKTKTTTEKTGAPAARCGPLRRFRERILDRAHPPLQCRCCPARDDLDHLAALAGAALRSGRGGATTADAAGLAAAAVRRRLAPVGIARRRADRSALGS